MEAEDFTNRIDDNDTADIVEIQEEVDTVVSQILT